MQKTSPKKAVIDAPGLRDRVLEFLDTAPPEISEWADEAARQLDASPAASRRKLQLPRAVLVLIALPLVIWGVWKIGAPPQDEASELPELSAGAHAHELDTAEVEELEARVEKDPNDIEAMSELGTLHLMAGDLDSAARWQQKILADHPEDLDARLALGVVLFNQGDHDAAKQQWEHALEIDPKSAEPHYNLGFLYLSEDPPDMELVTTHWEKVVELDPDSGMAETISTHLSSLGEDAEAPAENR